MDSMGSGSRDDLPWIPEENRAIPPAAEEWTQASLVGRLAAVLCGWAAGSFLATASGFVAHLITITPDGPPGTDELGFIATVYVMFGLPLVFVSALPGCLVFGTLFCAFPTFWRGLGHVASASGIGAVLGLGICCLLDWLMGPAAWQFRSLQTLGFFALLGTVCAGVFWTIALLLERRWKLKRRAPHAPLPAEVFS